jgi:hypothetical protein
MLSAKYFLVKAFCLWRNRQAVPTENSIPWNLGTDARKKWRNYPLEGINILKRHMKK